MTCATQQPLFRWLDALVGWDPAKKRGLVGFDDPQGLRLALADDAGCNAGAVDLGAVLRYLPPARLARGCGSCVWYLVPNEGDAPRLWRFDACLGRFKRVWPLDCSPDFPVAPVAVATRGHTVAVADPGTNEVYLWAREGDQLVLRLPVVKPGPLALTTAGELVVAVPGRLLRWSREGELLGTSPLPEGHVVERMAEGTDGALWVVTRDAAGQHHLSRDLQPATVAALAPAFAPSGITAADERGFSLQLASRSGGEVRSYAWRGCPWPASEPPITPPPLPRRLVEGELLTVPLDSGMPGCRWHRVRLDADVPAGTNVAVQVAVSEMAGDLSSLDAGIWTEPQAALDFLVDLHDPDRSDRAGRYLILRLLLRGNGTATPVVRRIRLDFPRATSLDRLPEIYRHNPGPEGGSFDRSPEVEDFTERFLSLFDAAIADVDAVVAQLPAMLSAERVHADALPWLAQMLGTSLPPDWDVAQRRRVLRALPGLDRARGTAAGMRQALELMLGAPVVLRETALERSFGVLAAARTEPPAAAARVNAVRLFGRARNRLRLGASALGRTPLRRGGDPDQDVLAAHAHRFEVHVPRSLARTPEQRARLTALIEALAPAHTAFALRIGAGAFVVGRATVGTVSFERPEATVLAGPHGNVRLRARSVLSAGRHGAVVGLRAGSSLTVGRALPRGKQL